MKKLIVIGGPTASGKTGLAIALAKKFHTEIISADSRQFYKKLDIGTAKPSSIELNSIVHHFINFLEPHEDYNIGRFEMDALEKINELFKTNEYLVLVGGSGLYIQAVCEGIDELPESDPILRAKFKKIIEEDGLEKLAEYLKEKDPEYFEIVDKKNKHRIIRALEVIEQSGSTYTDLRKSNKKTRPFDIIKIAIDLDRTTLYQKINERVDDMMKLGLVDEVTSLLPYRNLNALKTVGYEELFDYLDHTTLIDDAVELIKKHSRNYAKRQVTWFKRDKKFEWIKGNLLEEATKIIIRNSK